MHVDINKRERGEISLIPFLFNKRFPFILNLQETPDRKLIRLILYQNNL